MKIWREYEKAVSAFIVALDPNVDVQHNTFIPDIHTKGRRQRDVFIETKISNFFPIKIMISCKRIKRKLNEQDIDAFNGEFISSGANKGVIFSYSGFNDLAIEKCKVLGFSCCMLFENSPPNLPEVLAITKMYLCNSRINIDILEPFDRRWNVSTWEDLFNIKESNEYVIDKIVEYFHACETESMRNAEKNIDGNYFPLNVSTEFEVTNQKEFDPLKIRVNCSWRYHEGNINAILINGIYSFSDRNFIGSQTFPTIDSQSCVQNGDWTILSEIPNKKVNSFGINFLSNGDVKKSLVEGLSNIKIDFALP